MSEAAVYLSTAQVREIDRRAVDEYGMPGVVLMENAGRGAAELLLSLGVQGPVVMCCGAGNNGGDGYVIARHLDLHNIRVRVLLFADPARLAGDAAINLQILRRSSIPIEIQPAYPQDELANADWIVDALFGTGLHTPVRPPFDALIEAMNASGKKILAIDVPSGLDCASGQPLGAAIRASHTATFVAAKTGFATPTAKAYLGQVHVLSIGAPRKLIEEVIGSAPPTGRPRKATPVEGGLFPELYADKADA